MNKVMNLTHIGDLLVSRCGVSGLVVSIAGGSDGEESGDKHELRCAVNC